MVPFLIIIWQDCIIYYVIISIFRIVTAGTTPFLSTQSKWTPLLYASDSGHQDIVRLLLQKGANPNWRSAVCLHVVNWLKSIIFLHMHHNNVGWRLHSIDFGRLQGICWNSWHVTPAWSWCEHSNWGNLKLQHINIHKRGFEVTFASKLEIWISR